MDAITLRMMAFDDEELWNMICLDTDIAVSAKSFDELIKKMEDATILYLKSFSQEELLRRAYIRKAPASYRLKWHISTKLFGLLKLLSGPSEAIYDATDSHLRFA